MTSLILILVLFFGIFFLGLLGLGIFFWVSYNRLAKTRAKVENSWAQINVQLKMRADMIPSLAKAVKSYVKHESQTIIEATQARTKFLNSSTPQEAMQSSGEVGNVLGRLFAVAEQYPQLKADSSYINLQNQLSEIEQKIAMYRQFYNDTVLMFNNLVITFPQNFISKIFGFKQLPYFQIDANDAGVPNLDI